MGDLRGRGKGVVGYSILSNVYFVLIEWARLRKALRRLGCRVTFHFMLTLKSDPVRAPVADLDEETKW